MSRYLTKYMPVPLTELLTVAVVGCGGTGAILAEHLARMIKGYQLETELMLIDGDDVEIINITRQNFRQEDVGQNKAESLAFRLSAQFGIDVSYQPVYFTNNEHLFNITDTLVVTATDTLSSRKMIYDSFRCREHLWLDIGNEQHHGQAIIGTTSIRDKLRNDYWNWERRSIAVNLPDIAAINPALCKARRKNKRAGCVEMPFSEQGFGVNAMAALAAAKICKEVLVDGIIRTAGIYFDVNEGRMASRMIDKSLYRLWMYKTRK